jgi:hypothetical protein
MEPRLSSERSDDSDVPPGREDDDWTFTEWIPARRRSWQKLGRKFWRIPRDVKNQRYGICRECEHFIPLTTQCRLCLCAMGVKTWFAGFACPVGKWREVPLPEELADAGTADGDAGSSR